MVCTCAFPSQPSDYEHKDYERNATMYLKLNATQSLQKVKNLIQHYFRKLMFFHPFGIFNSVPRCVRITLKFSLTYSENFQWNSRQIEGVDATIFKQLYDNNTNARKSAKEREREILQCGHNITNNRFLNKGGRQKFSSPSTLAFPSLFSSQADLPTNVTGIL